MVLSSQARGSVRQSDLDNDTWELEAIIILDQEGSDDQ